MMAESKTVVIIALALGICLTVINYHARPRVQAERAAFATAQLQEVIDAANVQLEYTQGATVHPLRDKLNQTGRLEQITTPDGYNGNITFWLATIDEPDGSKVVGVRVIHHQETPGLGDKLELAISDWILGFNDQSLRSANWEVKKYGGDFDQFSGATITPRAVVRQIASRLRELEVNRSTVESRDNNG